MRGPRLGFIFGLLFTCGIAVAGSISPSSSFSGFLNNPLSLLEGTAPSATANYGKVYVKSSDSKLYYKDDSGTEFDLTVSGSGDVVGPASSTDNAMCRFDSTTGKLVQNSAVIVNDTGNIQAVGDSISSVAYSTAADPNTGISYPGSDVTMFVAGGAEVARISSDGKLGLVGTTPTGSNYIHLSTALAGGMDMLAENTSTGSASVSWVAKNNNGDQTNVGVGGSGQNSTTSAAQRKRSFLYQTAGGTGLGISLIAGEPSTDFRYYVGGNDISDEVARISSIGALGLAGDTPAANHYLHAEVSVNAGVDMLIDNINTGNGAAANWVARNDDNDQTNVGVGGSGLSSTVNGSQRKRSYLYQTATGTGLGLSFIAAEPSTDFRFYVGGIASSNEVSRISSGGAYLAPDGSVSAPGLSWSSANSVNSGIYLIGDDNYGFSANGVKQAEISTAGLAVATGLSVGGATETVKGSPSAYKTSDETVTSSTTLQDDDALTVAVVASGNYRCTAKLFATAGAISGGIKVALGSVAGGGATATGVKGQVRVTDDTTGAMVAVAGARFTALNSAIGAAFTTGTSYVEINAAIRVNGAGNLKITWAQNSSSADATTVSADSTFVCNRI